MQDDRIPVVKLYHQQNNLLHRLLCVGMSIPLLYVLFSMICIQNRKLVDHLHCKRLTITVFVREPEIVDEGCW